MEHEQFGRPPHLRPRSAGALRPSPRAGTRVVAPEELALVANSGANAVAGQLSVRLHTPRPGSVATTHRGQVLSPSAGLNTLMHLPQRVEMISRSETPRPTVLLSKPPMRPRSAISRTRKSVSTHRQTLTQHANPVSNNQSRKDPTSDPTLNASASFIPSNRMTSTHQAISATFHRNTFVYAVPQHCLERGRQYNPYDIVTVTHESLFGTNPRGIHEAKYDYYTVSSTGFTFHCKQNDFDPTFFTSDEWERQKTCFDKILKLPTFQWFRFRKVFLSWKKWIHSEKMATARSVLVTSLYFSNSILNSGMKAIRKEVAGIEGMNLLCDFEGKTCHLTGFLATNKEYLHSQGISLLKVTNVPSVVLHPELRAILEFADNIRSSDIQDGVMGNQADPEEEDDDSGSRWNKCNYNRLQVGVAEDQNCQILRHNIHELVSSASNGTKSFAQLYSERLHAHIRNKQTDFEQFRMRFRKGEYRTVEMERDLTDFKGQLEALQRLVMSQPVEFLQINVSRLRASLIPSPTRCLHELHVMFPVLAHEKCDQFLAFVRQSCKKIEKPHAADLDAFTRYLLHLRDVDEGMEERDMDLAFLHDLFRMFERLEISVPAATQQVFELCDPEYEALRAQLADGLGRRDSDIQEYSHVLAANIKELTRGIEQLANSSSEATMNATESASRDARELAYALEKHAETLTATSAQLIWAQHVFAEFSHGSRAPAEEFIGLQTLSHELKLKNELWEAVNDAEAYLESKRDETLRDINLSHLQDLLQKVEGVMKKIQQTNLHVPTLKRLENCKTVLEGLSPVIRDLRNEHMEERHWTKLENKMNQSFVRVVSVEQDEEDPSEEIDEAAPRVTTKEVKYLDLPFRHLIEVEAVNHAALIHQVSEEATAEAAITKSFQSVIQTWDTREIPTSPKKDREGRDAVCLGDCSEIMTLLEESEVLLRVVDSSSYARVIQGRLSKMLNDLGYTKETMDLLMACQQKWDHLQRLLSVDFFRHFSDQTKTFQHNDAVWKSIMDGIGKKPLCLQFGTNADARQLLQTTLLGFEAVSRCVDQHLETKRQAFPAFFKLSNLELASIVSKTRDVNNIQQFLYQCFDNVARINFGTREACQDVLSITSRSLPQREVILMGRNLKARGPAEQWLSAVEKRLVEMLRKSTKDAVTAMSQLYSGSSSGVDFSAVQALPLQSILIADRILRCELIDRHLSNDEQSDSQLGLHDSICQKLNQYQTEVIGRLFYIPNDGFGKSGLSRRDLVRIACLRLHEIEFRDAIEDHFRAVGTGGLGINWQLHMKHRFDDSTTVGYDCHVEINSVRIPYGFNFIDPTADLVVTPSSMRYLFAISTAVRHAQSSFLAGERSSGKKTLAYQISQILGRRFFGTTVSPGTNFCEVAHCLKLLRGALHSGGVFCLGLVANTPPALSLLSVLGTIAGQIEHSILTRLAITSLQTDPIQWVVGTSLIVSYRLPERKVMETRHWAKSVAAQFSVFWVMQQDWVCVIEAILYCKQYEFPHRTAQRLLLVWDQMRAFCVGETVSMMATCVFTFHNLKRIVNEIACHIVKNDEEFERENLQSFLLCEGIMAHCTNHQLPQHMLDQLYENLRVAFRYDVLVGEWYVRQWKRRTAEREAKAFLSQLERAIDRVVTEQNYVPRPCLSAKVVNTARHVASSLGTILVGPSGVGKSTTIDVLARALNLWKEDIRQETSKETTEDGGGVENKSTGSGSKVQEKGGSSNLDAMSAFLAVRIVLPMALTVNQLYGSTCDDEKGRVKSVLGRLLREAQETYVLSTDRESSVALGAGDNNPLGPLLTLQRLVLILFEGTLHSSWLDSLLCLMTRRPTISLSNYDNEQLKELIRFQDGEFMTVPPNVRFAFECLNLNAASPAIFQASSIVVFTPDQEVHEDSETFVPIHFAYIQRFLHLHRQAAINEGTSQSLQLSSMVYDTITNSLFCSDILAKIAEVIDEYGVSVPLTLFQRVSYLLALLQALLNSVASVCGSSIKPREGGEKAAIPVEDVRQRVDMALVYALLWGFSACCSDRPPLQLLISGMIKLQFEEIAHSWEDCGRDVNLFDLLLDLNGLRFVNLESGDTVILREKLLKHSVNSTPSVIGVGTNGPGTSEQLHSVFIPTSSSLAVHAAMKESLRSGRGALLVGGDPSRKTVLMQNLLKQIQPLRVLTTSSYANIPPPVSVEANGDVKRRRRAMPVVPQQLAAENAFASLDRIRLHQVTLVRKLAKKFRKVNKAAAALAAAQFAGSKKIAAQAEQKSANKDDTKTKKEQDWIIPPTIDPLKANMVGKFDLGDFIPFFFTMNQYDRGTNELTKCLERMLQRERNGIFEPPPGKMAVLIIDDLHMPIAFHDEEHPSCHDYLRSAYEHTTVFKGDTAAPISIEGLMMVASISLSAMPGSNVTSACRTKRDSMEKLVRQFIPVLAPPCSLSELHTIFSALLVMQLERNSSSQVEKLSGAVRSALPGIVAATTVLWEKLRSRFLPPDASAQRPDCPNLRFNLKQLARVYEGMCAVDPSYIMDNETLTRLWAHESIRSFGDFFGAWMPKAIPSIASDIGRLRHMLDELSYHRHGNNSLGGELTGVVPGFGGAPSTSKQGVEVANNLNVRTNAIGILSTFVSAFLEDKTSADPTQRNQQEKKRHIPLGLWAYVPSALYYQNTRDAVLRPGADTTPSSSDSTSTQGGKAPLQRRHSNKFIRRKSMEPGKVPERKMSDALAALSSSRWIYVDVLVDDTMDKSQLTELQTMFGGLQVFGVALQERVDPTKTTDLLLQSQIARLPRGTPIVTELLARRIAVFERVYSPPGSRVILIGEPGSGRDVMVRYACAVRRSTQYHSIWTIEGVNDRNVMTKKWNRLLRDLFTRIGVECESITLIVKRVDLWPLELVGQLLALMVSGEIPGAFTLKDQIRLATRVRDERLIEMEQQYQAQVTRIRQEADARREEEILQLRREDKETHRMRSTTFYQDLERKHQQALLFRLAQVQLRHQQELDDFVRKCEVENESVTATIMSLMRPLGMTSGKWQQIVQRMRKRLRIVVFVDTHYRDQLVNHVPQLFSVCHVVSFGQMDQQSLQTTLFGSFYVQTQQLFRKERAVNTVGTNTADIVGFCDQVEGELPTIVALATEMHQAAARLAEQRNVRVPSQLGLSLAPFFARVLEAQYHQDARERSNIEWFLFVHSSMEKALWKLQDRDGELIAQLEDCDRQIEVSQELLTEQKEDCERIRDMMKRYQEAAEQQVHVTNEMEVKAQAELHVPMACLEEANAALLLIDKRHIIEIKSFNSPPLLVHLVLDAICVMFKVDPTWENARKILGDSNIVNTMLAYDKDNIMPETLARIDSTYMSDPRFVREEVEKQSVAASMMVVWVRAMFQYATARHQVLPTLEKLEQAQSRLRLLMQEYQVSKQRVIEADEALVRTKTTLEDAKELRKRTMDEMESRRSRLDGGKTVLGFLKEDKSLADKASEEFRKERQLGLPWWNALFTAGLLSYGRLFDSGERSRLFGQWVEAYRAIVPSDNDHAGVSTSFVPSLGLSIAESSGESGTPISDRFQYPTERFDRHNDRHKSWQYASSCGVFFSHRRLQDTFCLTQILRADLPLVLITEYSPVMEDIILKCARSIWSWTHFYMVDTKASDLLSALQSAVREGHQLLVLDVTPLDVETKESALSALLAWETIEVQGQTHLVLSRSDVPDQDGASARSVPLHPSFRAILITYASAAAFGETLTTSIPLLRGTLDAPEVADVILDRMWSPGLPNGQNFALKQSVREFERLSKQLDATRDQLTKLMQATATRGEFQLEETGVIRDVCEKTLELRSALTRKRQDIADQAQFVKKHQSLARLGAAMFNACNSRQRVVAAIDYSEEGEPSLPPVSLDVFLPIYLVALQAPVGQSRTNWRTQSSFRQSSASIGGGDSFRSAMVKMFDSTSEIINKMLAHLMPIFSGQEDWYDFLLQMFWLVEQNQETSVQDKSLNEETELSQLQMDVKDMLSIVKLQHSQAPAHSSNPDKAGLEELVAMIVNGCPTVISETEAPSELRLANLALSGRNRVQRMKVGLSLDPRAFQLLCDQMVQAYGAQIRYNLAELDQMLASVIPGASEACEEEESSTRPVAGWRRLLTALPESTWVVIESHSLFGSFEFLCQVINSTSVTRKHRLNIMKAAQSRSFLSHTDLKEVYLVPHHRLLVIPESSSTGDRLFSMQNNVLMVQESETVVHMSSDALDQYLDEVSLAIVNMQTANVTHAPAYWEEFFHLVNRSPQRTTSLAFRRYESAIAQVRSNGGYALTSSLLNQSKPAAPVSLTAQSATATTSRPTARRLSTQGLRHRNSDIALVNVPSRTSLVAVAQSVEQIPQHLRSSLLWFASPTTDAAIEYPSLRQCFQMTLLRIAYHPSYQLVNQLTSVSDDKAAKTGSETIQDQAVHKKVWHYLTALLVYHALLAYRWQLSRHQSFEYELSGASPCGHYGSDVLATAISQLLHMLVQFQSNRTAIPHRLSLISLVKQHVFLAAYSRQAKSSREVTILRSLGRECLCLVEDAMRVDSDGGNGGMGSSFRALVSSGSGIGSGRSVTSRNMTQRLLARRPSTAHAPSSSTSGYNSSSRKIFSRRSSLKDSTSSLLTGLNIPIQDLSILVDDFDTWIDFSWNYSEQVDDAIEHHVRDLFGLLPPVIGAKHSRGSPSRVPVSMELFGWTKRPVMKADDLHRQITLEEAARVLQNLRDLVLPPTIVEGEEDDNRPIDASPVDDDESTPPNESMVDEQSADESIVTNVSPTEDATSTQERWKRDRQIEDQCIDGSVCGYNSHIRHWQAFLDRLTSTISGAQTASASLPPKSQSLAVITSQDIRGEIASVLCNVVPIRLRDELSAVTTIATARTNLTLAELVSFYQSWYRQIKELLVNRHEDRLQPTWWLPGLYPRTKISHLIELAKLKLARSNQTDSEQYQVSFTLQLDPTDDSHAESNGVESSADKPRAEEDVVVLSGLSLHMAVWDTERRYLQPMDQHSPRVPQRVRVLGRIEIHKEAKQSSSWSGEAPSLEHRNSTTQAPTRSCPVMTQKGVALELDLPIGPALGSFVTPYLTVAMS
ncbi:hypothetical protein Poli38472_011528 [Pythium oligandrum]|uniref:Dynein heavy chain n=1 Tax=Pythium oligandrum TaxID=41045 RepID=A0A8K1FNH5_PYTOL|nr:hypothetical protein Poli38472_011528 [Pythium oligandrum]|eukprot:TMW64648.1 hypothetical protein Poli38472_011528 [Pythium oligandrum]